MLCAEVVGIVLIAVGTAMVLSAVRDEKVAVLLGEGRFQAAARGPILTALVGLIAAVGAVIVT